MLIHLILSVAAAEDFSGGALPEGVNVQSYRPAMDSTSTLWTNDSLRAESGSSSARAGMHYAHLPAVYERGDGETTALVSGIWQMDVIGTHTRGPLRIGLDVPIYLRSVSDLAGNETGMGDLVVDLRYSALDRREAPVGLALSGRALLPTATMDSPLSTGLSWEAEGVVDAELGTRWLVAANVGARFLPSVALENIEMGNQAYLRVGASRAFSESAGLSLDMAANGTWGELSNPKALPAELLVGGYGRISENWMLRGGVGGGLSSGLGAPAARVVTGVSWQPS